MGLTTHGSETAGGAARQKREFPSPRAGCVMWRGPLCGEVSSCTVQVGCWAQEFATLFGRVWWCSFSEGAAHVRSVVQLPRRPPSAS